MAKQLKQPPQKQATTNLTVKRAKSVDELNRQYDPKTIFEAGGGKTHSVPDMIKKLKESDTDIDAVVYIYDKKTGEARPCKMNKTQFLEAFNRNARKTVFREAINNFDSNPTRYQAGGDTIPILGGPFNKQLYLHDYLKMHNEAFKIYHEEPIANAAIQIIHDFVLGRGFRVDIANQGDKGKMAQAVWRAFEEANDLQKKVSDFVKELEIYGEHFWYFIPDNFTKDSYQLKPDQEPPKGIIPRVMLIDPSTIWEVITYPEDISRVLCYQQVYPTQYQLYNRDNATGETVQGTKYIYRQLPADAIIHEKINCVSNEKRGRTTFYPIIGYLKRLKDSINYSLLSQIKQSAWSIDTQIDGNQQDIDDYRASVEALGNIPAAGSEFIHSTKVTRTFISNDGASKSGGGMTWDYAFSMVCAGLGIPQQYFGTHLAGASSRASAIVATEPVAKKFEYKQQIVENVLKKMAKQVFSKFGITGVDIEVTFPEVVVQNRTEKIKDVLTARQAGVFSKERAATIVAKELQATDYEFAKEQVKIKGEMASGIDDQPKDVAQIPNMISPLTSPAATPQTGGGNDDTQGISNKTKTSVEKSGRA